ncbi:hypothetical protein [Peribacillus butanolivorans]|nr:hypothetical protein [Peribacillus butanolivorans]
MIILNEPIVSPILLKVLEKQQIPSVGAWAMEKHTIIRKAKHSKRYGVF